MFWMMQPHENSRVIPAALALASFFFSTLWTTEQPTQLSFRKARSDLRGTSMKSDVALATLLVWLSPTVGYGKIQGGSNMQTTLSRLAMEQPCAVSPPIEMVPLGTHVGFLRILSCNANNVTTS
jgi:hypothetical protein